MDKKSPQGSEDSLRWRVWKRIVNAGKTFLSLLRFLKKIVIMFLWEMTFFIIQDWHSPVYSGTKYICWVHWCTIWGHWNFRLLVIPNLSYDCDIWKHLVFRLLLALCRLVGLSKRRIIEPSFTAFIGFPFAIVFFFLHVPGMRYITSRSTWGRRV